MLMSCRSRFLTSAKKSKRARRHGSLVGTRNLNYVRSNYSQRSALLAGVGETRTSSVYVLGRHCRENKVTGLLHYADDAGTYRQQRNSRTPPVRIRELSVPSLPIYCNNLSIVRLYSVCQKSDTILVSEFSTFVIDALYLQFLFTYISFSLNGWYQSQVSSVQMDSPAGWCTTTHCEKHGKLPQRENVSFIDRASDVASKQPWFKSRWLCCLGWSSAASLA